MASLLRLSCAKALRATLPWRCKNLVIIVIINHTKVLKIIMINFQFFYLLFWEKITFCSGNFRKKTENLKTPSRSSPDQFFGLNSGRSSSIQVFCESSVAHPGPIFDHFWPLKSNYSTYDWSKNFFLQFAPNPFQELSFGTSFIKIEQGRQNSCSFILKTTNII